MVTITTDVKKIGTSSNYEQRYKVTYVGGTTTSSKTQEIIIQPQVRKTDSTYKRMLHQWFVYIKVGNTVVVNTTINNMPTQYVGPGYVNMQKNVWYDWGKSYKCTITNAGNNITITGMMYCVTTVPRDSKVYSNKTITLPRHTITPGIPQNPTSSFNTTSRIITYSWGNGGNTAYYKVYTSHYNEAGELIRQGYIGNNITTTSVSEIVSDQTTSITWKVTAYSSTGDKRDAAEKQVTVDAYHKVYVKVDGIWKKAIPWVKVDNTWKKCNKAYVKVDNTWKLTKI